MLKLTSVAALLFCVALASAEPRLGPQQQQRQLRSGAAIASSNHPYIFLARPRTNGDGHEVQGFKVVQIGDNDDDDDVEDNAVNNINKESNSDDEDIDDAKEDDDDEGEQDNSVHSDDGVDNADDDDDDASFELNDDDDEIENDANDVASNIVFLRSRVPHSPRLRSQLKNQNAMQSSSTFVNRASQLNAQLVLKNAKPTNMMVSREHAGAIMVPDGFIEIEGQSVFDEKTGKTALVVPRAALDAIPDGSVVALVESSVNESEEARANRVIVRRRRKGSRRNVVRRRGGNRRRQGGNRRRRGGNRRKSVRVYQVGGATRRRGSRRGGRPVVLQG